MKLRNRIYGVVIKNIEPPLTNICDKRVCRISESVTLKYTKELIFHILISQQPRDADLDYLK
jgi:hypothetical protein